MHWQSSESFSRLSFRCKGVTKYIKRSNIASKFSMSWFSIFIHEFLKNEEILVYSKVQGHLLLALGFGCFNEKITGNLINSVNTYHFFSEPNINQEIFWGPINRVPILWKQKLQISDENFSMSQIFSSSKIIIFKNLGCVPKLWVSNF